MNCKPGDLALVIWARPEASIKVGSVVRCDIYYTGPAKYEDGSSTLQADTWLVEFRGAVELDGAFWNVPDEHLRPIRDNDGEDETMQWAPVPSRELVSSK